MPRMSKQSIDTWLVWWTLAGTPKHIPEDRFWGLPFAAFIHQSARSWFNKICADGTIYSGPMFVMEKGVYRARILYDVETCDWYVAVTPRGARWHWQSWRRTLPAAKQRVRALLTAAERPTVVVA